MAFNSTAYPYDTVVRITDTIGNQEYQASGVLISPDEVLTASHVVYIDGVGAASNIVVTPAYNDGTAPHGSADGTSFHYMPIDDTGGQISNADSQSDYAVIHLSTPFTGLGTMGLSTNFAGGSVTIAGYPTSANGAMVANTQTVHSDPNYTLLDGVTIGKGSSGAPLIAHGATDPRIVGIVSSESNVGQTGYNTLITRAVYNQIEQWVQADDGTTTTSPPALTQAPAAIQTPGGNAGSQDSHGWNHWTHRLDSKTLRHGPMGFIGSTKSQSNLQEGSSTFAGWDTSTAANWLHDHMCHQANGSTGDNWSSKIDAVGSIAQGLLQYAESHFSTAVAPHHTWAHTS